MGAVCYRSLSKVARDRCRAGDLSVRPRGNRWADGGGSTVTYEQAAGGLFPGMGFLDSGLRRNDGGAFLLWVVLRQPGLLQATPFVVPAKAGTQDGALPADRRVACPFVLRKIEGRMGAALESHLGRGGLFLGMGFLDSGLRRNDGGAFLLWVVLRQPGLLQATPFVVPAKAGTQDGALPADRRATCPFALVS